MKTFVIPMWLALLCSCSNGITTDAGIGDQGFEAKRYDPQRATGAQTSAGQHAMRAHQDRAVAYEATSYAVLEAEAAMAGASLDSRVAHQFAGSICSSRSRPEGDLPESVQTSYRELARFQSRFCSGSEGYAPQLFFDFISAAAADGDRDALVIQELSRIPEDVTPEEVEELRTVALAQARATSSATAYRMIHEDLLQNAFRPDYAAPIGLSDEEAALARGLGVAIATCDRFGACVPGSIMVMAYCQPFSCTPGHDMRAHVRSRLSARGFEEALRYAREIQSKE